MTTTAVAEVIELHVAAPAAAQINELHRLALEHRDAAVDHARQAGLMLLQVKAGLPHGQFLPWLAANVDFTARTAQRYMNAAAPKPECDSLSYSTQRPKYRIPLRKCKLSKREQALMEHNDQVFHRNDVLAHVYWMVDEITDVQKFRPADITVLIELRKRLDDAIAQAQECAA